MTAFPLPFPPVCCHAIPCRDMPVMNLLWRLRARGDFGRQALMELGATVCTAKSPDCSACPVKASCLAHKLTTAAGDGQTGGLKSEAASKESSSSTSMGAKAPQTKPAFPSSSSSSSSPSSTTTPSRGRAPASSLPDSSREGAECGCTVCELGEDGMAAMPEAVTDFPRKAAKT